MRYIVEFHDKKEGNMVISFIGHSTIFDADGVKLILKGQILSNLADDERISCYLGGYGDFDEICASVCRELKAMYNGLELVYVTPYFDLSSQQRIKEMIGSGLYDGSIYPPIENAPKKYAILKRNEWMISNSDLVIAYVKRNCGGAYRSLEIARRKGKKIINIFHMIKKEQE